MSLRMQAVLAIGVLLSASWGAPKGALGNAQDGASAPSGQAGAGKGQAGSKAQAAPVSRNPLELRAALIQQIRGAVVVPPQMPTAPAGQVRRSLFASAPGAAPVVAPPVVAPPAGTAAPPVVVPPGGAAAPPVILPGRPGVMIPGTGKCAGGACGVGGMAGGYGGVAGGWPPLPTRRSTSYQPDPPLLIRDQYINRQRITTVLNPIVPVPMMIPVVPGTRVVPGTPLLPVPSPAPVPLPVPDDRPAPAKPEAPPAPDGGAKEPTSAPVAKEEVPGVTFAPASLPEVTLRITRWHCGRDCWDDQGRRWSLVYGSPDYSRVEEMSGWMLPAGEVGPHFFGRNGRLYRLAQSTAARPAAAEAKR